MEALRPLLFLILSLLHGLTVSWPDGHARFKTEPTFTPLIVNVTTNKDPSALAPGYVFLTPNGRAGAGNFYGGYGLHIFDVDGELIWYGNDTADHRALRGHVCDYLGEPKSRICWHDGARVRKTFNFGVIRFFDETYTQVGEVHDKIGDLDQPDGHVINTAEVGESLLQDVFQHREMGKEAPVQGVVLDCCFQEVNMRTGELVFQWCAIDHLPICDFSPPVDGVPCWKRQWYGGQGTQDNPWDVWHMNSIDKNEEGDYLTSIRHLDTVVKVAGNNNVHGVEPGTILWALNGEKGTIKQKGYKFSRQHVARFINTTSTTTTFTLLNNAWSGNRNVPTSERSAGLLIEVNNSTNKSTVLVEYPNPDNNLSGAAGNMHMLENGNMFVGWGSVPNYSEFDHEGNLLYHAGFVGDSPQAWKFPWVGKPKTKPKIVAYMLQCSMDYPTYAYVSWNGATELRSWEVYASNASDTGPWKLVGTSPKHKFETQIGLNSFALFFYAKAYDYMHAVMEESEVVELFVPNKTQSKNCDQEGCNTPERFAYEREWSYVDDCTRTGPFKPPKQGAPVEPAPIEPAPVPTEPEAPPGTVGATVPTGKTGSGRFDEPFGPENQYHNRIAGLLIMAGIVETLNWIMVGIFWPWKFNRLGSSSFHRNGRFALR